MSQVSQIFDLKTGERRQTLADFIQYQNIKLKDESFHLKNLKVYIAGRRCDNTHWELKPRSRLTVIKKDVPKPDIEIVHREKSWIALNKPAGLSTQKTLLRHEANLYDFMRLYLLFEKNFPVHEPYVGLHHRLDRDTSGLVLMTLQTSLNAEVAKLFRDKTIQKTYRAQVEWGKGIPPHNWHQVDQIVRGQHAKHRFYFTVSDQAKGDEAISDFQLVQTVEAEKYHELLCFPRTGRTHQLRVQLKAAGWPIIGDPVYGSKKKGLRLRLHAERLEFNLKGQNFYLTVPAPW